MNYASWHFYLLFAGSAAAYWLANSPRQRFVTLLAASILFYSNAGATAAWCFTFVFFATWFGGREGASPTSQWAAIFVVVLDLVLWKWLARHGQALPLGISFYSMQALAYLFDRRLQRTPALSWSNLLLFKSFFPQLIMGPIVRAKELAPRLLCLHRPNLNQVEVGLLLFTIGLLKKKVLADPLAPMVENAFHYPEQFSAPDLWLGAFAFWCQLWADFSGYTDMALGAALCFGISLPQNFREPYWSTSPTDFWRRWHATFSSWVRDYLYIPMGGNRRSPWRNTFTLYFIMMITSLWHAFSSAQLAFGAIHASGLIGHRLWQAGPWKIWFNRTVPAPLYGAAAWMITQIFVLVAWVFFRSESATSAADYIAKALAIPSVAADNPERQFHAAGIFTIGILVLLLQPVSEWVRERSAAASSPRSIWWHLCVGALIGLGLCLAQHPQLGARPLDFVYFQF